MVFSSAGMGLSPGVGNYLAELPHLADWPFLSAMTLFSHLFILMLALEWFWRTAWGLKENPTEPRDPSAMLRWTFLLILLALLFRMVPDTIQAMTWTEASPSQRQALLLWDKWLDDLSVIPFAIAWGLAYLGGPLLVYQLRREPLPLHLWPTPRQAARPAKIAGACLALALALTYLR